MGREVVSFIYIDGSAIRIICIQQVHEVKQERPFPDRASTS